MSKRREIIQDLLNFLEDHFQLTGYALVNEGMWLNTWYTNETDLQEVAAAVYEEFGYRNESHGPMFIKTRVSERTLQIAYFSGYRHF